MNTIKIKKWNTKEVIFEYEGENPTLKDAVEEAVRQGISLEWADLEDADLKGANLSKAYLSYANLEGADLEEADLKNADLHEADLSEANLFNANLSGADLSGAYLGGAELGDVDLSYANLEGADLSDANINFANLNGADLNNANLKYTDLYTANLYRANLKGADIYATIFDHAIGVPDDLMPLACPSEGSFIAWKKVDDKLVKLEIPEDAKRSSATTHECRCSKAKVLAITNLDETESFDEVFNDNYATLTYKVGEIVYPDSFDENRWNTSSHGIHFFMDKEDALNG